MASTSAFQPLSAAVTRILSLSGFPAHLKTRDIQGAFTEWENVNGGFKIKWIDDTNLLMVFQDASIAKRAYLSALASPHPIFSSPADGNMAIIRPYDGPDAQAVIQAVSVRANGGGVGHGGHRARASMSAGPTGGSAAAVAAAQAHIRGASLALGVRPNLGNLGNNLGREPSPTLPALPHQPTLDALIAEQLEASAGSASPPKLGDPGRRMVGAALGIRHPALGQRAAGGSGDGQKVLTVAE